MNLLYIGTLPPHPGGSATASAPYLAGLGRLGHVVHALAPITAVTRAAGEAFARQYPALRIHRYEIDRFLIDSWKGWSDRISARETETIAGRLPRLIDRTAPEIVIAGRESYAWILPEILKRFGIPTLAIAHGALIRRYDDTGGPVADEPTVARLRTAHATAVPSSHMREAACRFQLSPVYRIGNPVDMSRFTPTLKCDRLLRSLDLDRDHVVVVHASNMKPLKRAGDVVDAAIRCLGENPNLRFVFVGDGHDRRVLEARCVDAGIDSCVRFTGWVDSASMPAYVNLADIVVQCSEFENQPMIILESQACARAVVASDIPGHRELITDGDSGHLYPVGDVDALATRILELASDEARRMAIGTRARRVVACHDSALVARRYETVLRSIVRAG